MLRAAMCKRLTVPQTFSLDQLYDQAVALDPVFRVRVQRLAALCNGHFYVGGRDAGEAPQLRTWTEIERDEGALAHVEWPAVKMVHRALRKVDLHYHGNVSRLVDIVRQRIIFRSLADIERCLQAIVDDPQLEVAAVKNRFELLSPAVSTAGYRDVLVVLRVVTELTTSLGISGHACELQLAHQEMAQLVTPAEHLRYSVGFRACSRCHVRCFWWIC